MEKNEQMANVNDSFTAKEEKFCYEYCIDLNATKAAIRAGYSQKTARSIGYQNLLKLHIQKKIKETQNDLAKAAGISALRVINEHAKIAFASIGDYLEGNWELKDLEILSEDQKAPIREVTTKDTKTGKETNIKMHDKVRSLDALCNLLGFYAPVKNEVTGKDGKDLLSGQTFFLELIKSASTEDLKSIENKLSTAEDLKYKNTELYPNYGGVEGLLKLSSKT